MVKVVDGFNGASVSRAEFVRPPTGATAAPPVSGAEDAESREWLRCLRADGDVRHQALARLHALLLRVARYEVARRRATLSYLRGNELDDIAYEAADDALMSLLARLDDFRGRSRFTTWVYKFALFEVVEKLRRRAWQGVELPIEPEAWTQFASLGLEPAEQNEQRELLTALQQGVDETLTPHQRRVFVALALNGVPIDVLAERLHTTRGALYKTLHDARKKLRRQLTEKGLAPKSSALEVT